MSSVRIHTVATGEDRELLLSDTPIVNCVWPSQPSVVYCGKFLPEEDKTALLSIDPETGRAETLASFPGSRLILELSADGRTFKMISSAGPALFPRWKIGTDQEIPSPYPTFSASADGRWAFRPGTDAAQRRNLEIRPASAGNDAWEHLVYRRKQSPDTRGPVPIRFSPDGNWVVYPDLDSDDKDALFRVSTSGGEQQRLGTYPTTSPNSHLDISPDGQHFVVETSMVNPTTTESRQSEYWILQNFLPRPVRTSSKP